MINVFLYFQGFASKLASYPYFTKMAYNMLHTGSKFKSLLNIDAHSLLWGYNDSLTSLVHNILPGYMPDEQFGLLSPVSIYILYQNLEICPYYRPIYAARVRESIVVYNGLTFHILNHGWSSLSEQQIVKVIVNI